MRILLTLIMVMVLMGGGIYILTQDSIYLRDKSNPNNGTIFIGFSKLSLSAAVFALAAFIGLCARDQITGEAPDPSIDHAAARGEALYRHRYVILILILTAIMAYSSASYGPQP